MEIRKRERDRERGEGGRVKKREREVLSARIGTFRCSCSFTCYCIDPKSGGSSCPCYWIDQKDCGYSELLSIVFEGNDDIAAHQTRINTINKFHINDN